MSNISRKQREIAERHASFLDIAYDIFVTEGYQQMNMSNIADAAEYSKGTVYQHFHCKEEVLVQLCNQCMQDLSTLFVRAKEFNGTPRERLTAVFLAMDLWGRLKPKNHDLLQTFCADGIKEKVNRESLDRHYALEGGLISLATDIVQEGLESGDLPPLQHLGPYELVFGLWSLGFGGQLLLSLDLPLEKLGICNAQSALFSTMSTILDGLNWQPLSTEFDYQAATKRIGEEIFSAELALIENGPPAG